MGEHVKEAAAPRRYRVTFLSVIGELLITIAVILGLFAVWQLYWTKQSRTSPASTHRTESWVSVIPTIRQSSP